MKRNFLVYLSCLFSIQTWAVTKVVTSTTDLAWAVREIGGEHVEVNSLLKGHENPHYVDALPEFIRLTADAQVVCLVGLDLEVGWMPKVLSRSGNAQVQPGGKGYCEVGKAIHVLEKPTGNVDRSMGDVHPGGNPHFWLSPTHLGQAAQEITQVLIAVDPAHGPDYRAGLQKITHKLSEIQASIEKKIKAALGNTAAGVVLIEYHKEFSYFLNVYGLKSLGSIEEKPGVAPSAGRLAEIAQSAKQAGIKFVLAAETAPKKTLERFSELSGIPFVVVPMSLQPGKGLSDFAVYQEKISDSVAKALTTPKT